MTNLKNIEQIAKNFDNDVNKIALELRRLQSIKCRLKKQKGKSTYEVEMTKVIQEEQALKEARALLNPKEKHVTQYEQSDVDMLDYDETIKAIKSIQSKKTLTRWLTTEEGDNDEYRMACKIEQMLLEHKNNIKPIDETTIRKTDLVTIIDTIKSSGELTQERIVELLEGLL
jgi:hypothetical protein